MTSNTRLRLFALTLVLATFAAIPSRNAHASPGNPGWGTNLFADHVARNAGDIVTVLVMETATARGEISSDTKREESISGGPGTGPFDFIPEFSAEGQNEHTGNATMNRTGRLVAKVPARVVAVLSDGTLQLEGSREVVVNGEHDILEVRGLVRPLDIAPDNTVASSVMADARIEYAGKGTMTNGQRMSRFMRLVNWIF